MLLPITIPATCVTIAIGACLQVVAMFAHALTLMFAGLADGCCSNELTGPAL